MFLQKGFIINLSELLDEICINTNVQVEQGYKACKYCPSNYKFNFFIVGFPHLQFVVIYVWPTLLARLGLDVFLELPSEDPRSTLTTMQSLSVPG